MKIDSILLTLTAELNPQNMRLIRELISTPENFYEAKKVEAVSGAVVGANSEHVLKQNQHFLGETGV